jgi:uncharacterized protein YigA (DUF484 family)
LVVEKGDAEDRVDRSLIRMMPPPTNRSGYADDPVQLEAAREENRTLRQKIAQMISLSQEEDAETEKLMQSMHASLSEARRANADKGAEVRGGKK